MNIKKQIQQLGDMNRFSIKELFSDNSGKTSASSFVGVIVTLVGTSIFAYCSIIKNLELVSQAVMVIGLGAALLGVNKVMNGKPISETTEVTDEKETVQEN
jgi:sulfite exporter TauE/SafE